MNELESHVEMTEPHLHTTFIRRRCSYFWNKQWEQIPGICWSSVCLQLVRAHHPPCWCLQIWIVPWKTITRRIRETLMHPKQDFTGVYHIVCSLKKLKPLSFSWYNFLFRQPDQYFGRFDFTIRTGASIFIWNKPYILPAKDRQLFSKTNPKVLMQLKSIGIWKYSIPYLYIQDPKLSGIENHEIKILSEVCVLIQCMNSKHCSFHKISWSAESSLRFISPRASFIWSKGEHAQHLHFQPP